MALRSLRAMDTPGQRFRFGPYESRPESRELYKHGFKLKVRPQPLQVLNTLLSRAGEVVTRDDLRRRLWSSETFVDFEHSLYTSVKEIRGVLGDSANEPRYIQTLPKLGYRFIAPVEVIESAAAAIPGAPDSTAEDSDAPAATSVGSTPWRWTLAGAIVAVFLVALGAGAYYFHIHQETRPQPALNRFVLAVLPFENLTGDPAQEYLSDGLTEEMIAQLGRLDPAHLGVIARTSVMHYKHGQEQLQQIGRELAVQYVLEGSVRRDSGKVRISAQLVQMKDQTPVWSRQFDRELGGLLALQGEIAQEIADEIQPILGSDHKGIAADRKFTASTNSYEAYDLYLKGRYFWNKRTKEGFQQAAEYFQQAISKDPNYARAYAGLADTYGLMSTWSLVPQNEFMPKARDAALKALRIDANVAEAHASLALVAENYDYDWQTAEKEFRQAIQLDPAYGTAHQWYAECLSFRGQFAEALAESERARQLDPLSVIIARDHGTILYFSRQYDRAIEQFRTVREMDPDFPPSGALIQAYVQKGQFTDAFNELEKWRTPDHEPWYWSYLAYVCGRSGQWEQARRALAKLEHIARHSKSELTVLLLVAYVGMDRRDEAIALLQKAYSQHSSYVVALKVEPYFDPLRSDPLFQDLLRRVGLAE